MEDLNSRQGGNNVIIPTEDKLFDHDCQFKDMKLSAFNPKSLTYYCQVCGGKFIIEKDMKDWNDLFGEPITLKLNKKVLNAVLNDREAAEREEQEQIKKKEEEALQKAFQARKKAEEARQKDEEERARKMKELDTEGEV